MNKKKKTGGWVSRSVADIALFSAAMVLPWPVTLASGAVLSFKFSKYWEMPLAGLVIDSLFYYPEFGVFGAGGLKIATFLIFLFVFLLAEGAKKYLKV